MKWALLVPTKSLDGHYEWSNLLHFFETLHATTSARERERMVVYFGIDEDDKPLTEGQLFTSRAVQIAKGIECAQSVKVPVEQKGQVCRIWNTLAVTAMQDGCDFFVFLGDDISFKSPGWMTSIERKFRQIWKKTGRSRLGGCVAFNDLTFPNFPTFPVLHASHMNTFGEVFCDRFINQGGDPFLFELYNRLGAAAIEESAKIRNKIGGNSASRYEKTSIRFKNAILSQTLDVLRRQKEFAPVLPCLDVVVPTYRLNFDILEKITNLRVLRPCRVKFWIVVDNPDHPLLDELRELYDGKSQNGNYTIQVLVHPKNLGASAARNTGMMRSCADWIILLDDDVTPEPNLLDAYLAATFRNPDVDAFAGVTELPRGEKLWQKALEVSGVTYFYKVASKMTHVPWSVSANLCIKGRANEGVMFRLDYPNSGGGEDVDFCFRLKNMQLGIVAVANAVAHHPWFGNNAFEAIRHVMKWVIGDSRCVEVLPQHTYSVLPGWTEFILVATIPAVIFGIFFKLTFQVIGFETFFKTVAFLTESPADSSTAATTPVTAFCASLLLMGQEVNRTACHLRRKCPRALCRRLDWFDGMNQAATALSKRQHASKCIVYMDLFCYLAAM